MQVPGLKPEVVVKIQMEMQGGDMGVEAEAGAVEAAQRATGSAIVPFVPPEDDGGATIEYFQVVGTAVHTHMSTHTIDSACSDQEGIGIGIGKGMGARVTVQGSRSPITVTGLHLGASYVFRVAAVNKFGPGPFSAPTAPTEVAPSLLQHQVLQSRRDMAQQRAEMVQIQAQLIKSQVLN